MRKELIVKGKSLAGVSDLTLFAPIRQGFAPSLESVTYKTRLQMLLKTLSLSRASSQEYSLVRPFSDSVERVGAIHSVRVVILEPQNKVMLAVTFDGAWENYIRTLWLKVGTLLDAIFCNTDDYVTAYGHSYAEWLAWVRRVQVETQFFYGMPALSVADVQYLRKTETMYRQDAATGDLAAAGAVVERPEDIAWRAATQLNSRPDPRSAAETLKQGLQALSVLYRLADVYLPGTPDGDILVRAARDLLLELVEMQRAMPAPPPLPPAVAKRFERQLRWFADAAPERARRVPAPTPYDRGDVQGGILHGFDKVTHGCLLLISFPEPTNAARFLSKLQPLITRDDAAPQAGEVIRSIAFTCEGLRALGLSEPELAAFPQEFREGMEARASGLGDFRANHPRRWSPPLRNWAGPWPGDPTVELSAVHLIVQLRVEAPAAPSAADPADAGHPLNAEIHSLLGDASASVTLLSIQPLRRNFDAGKPREHFGFVDGISQPIVDPAQAGGVYDRLVHLGDLLLGYPNTFDPAPPRMDLQHNGSFLVIRKLRQDVAALTRAVESASSTTGLSVRDVLAKMMGRTLDGDPLVAAAGGAGQNDFDYTGDPLGHACPFQSHVRRANPRPGPVGRTDRETPVPRIMRRGMSYGPPYDRSDPDAPVNARERGIVFMAYNARIAEQFEVIQRWLSGANSSGVLSGQSDPFLGVAQRDDPRTFRFVDQPVNPKVKRADLDDPSNPLDDPKQPPFVRLEWGAYLFAPSIKAIAALQRVAEHAAAAPAAAPAWSADEGEKIISQLQALETQPGLDLASMWKSVLEDPTARREFTSASVWAAIRERRGGVLRTPYGVLVAGRALVEEVFVDPHRRYTVKGYQERTGLSFGEIYLGLDRDAPGGDYDREATLSNAAIQRITLRHAFRLARAHAARIVAKRIALDQALAKQLGKPTWELNLDTKEVSDDVLARLCEDWFGLPGKGGHLAPGSLRWDWKEGEPLLYPGHFTAPSRYVFQPAPGSCPMQLGQRHGQALRAAVRRFGADHRLAGTVPATPSGAEAPVGAATFNDPAASADLDWFARTFVGALVGFLPSVDGNFRATLNEWLKDDTFWRLRDRLVARHTSDAFADAQAVLWPAMMRTMQLRPSPELVWRIARQPHRLGLQQIEAGETIVVAIVSATQEDLAAGRDNVLPIFGGERRPGVPQPGFPTHACPGYQAGIGTLLGMYSALMSVRESMRPSPAPLSLTLGGPTPP